MPLLAAQRTGGAGWLGWLAGVAARPPASVAPVQPAVDTVPAVRPTPTRGPADAWMCWLLRLDDATPPASDASARSVLERSLLISMARCLLTYVFLPFVAPVLGVAGGVAPALGLVIGVVAVGFNVASIRRFWRADHRYRWHYTTLSTIVIVLLMWLVVVDVIDLIG